jgi:hypothetical protein
VYPNTVVEGGVETPKKFEYNKVKKENVKNNIIEGKINGIS